MTRKTAVALALCAGCIIAIPRSAIGDTYPDLTIFENLPHVPDHELDRMRGRFVVAGQVHYFGLQLTTQWLTTTELISAGLGIVVNFPNSAGSPSSSDVRPTFTASRVPVGPDAPSEAGLVQSTGPGVKLHLPDAGGLETVSGVVQSIQLGGDENQVRNDLQLNIVDRSGTGSPATAAAPVPTELHKSESVAFEGGAVANFVVARNAVGLSVEVPGAGVLLQQIRGDTFNRIAQHANIRTDFNRILNMMEIEFRVSSAGLAGRPDLQAAMQSLRGLTR